MIEALQSRQKGITMQLRRMHFERQEDKPIRLFVMYTQGFPLLFTEHTILARGNQIKSE